MAAFKHLGFTFLHLLNYISIVWMTAGLTIALMFLFGYYLSGSIVGGLMPVVSFPLRENYASPIGLSISVSTTLLITCLLNAVALRFGNEILFTSCLFSGLLAHLVTALPLDSLCNHLHHPPTSDVELLKSKFTNFKTLHTLYQYLHFVWKKFIILEMTDKIAVISGQMPTMANLLLSTERPIVNRLIMRMLV